MSQQPLLHFIKNWLPTSYTIFLFILTTYPSIHLPETNFSDKTAHFLAFGILAILWLWKIPNFLKVSFFCVLFGIFVEIWQWLLPEYFHRSFELLDILADSIGVFLGTLLYYAASKLLNKDSRF